MSLILNKQNESLLSCFLAVFSCTAGKLKGTYYLHTRTDKLQLPSVELQVRSSFQVSQIKKYNSNMTLLHS